MHNQLMSVGSSLMLPCWAGELALMKKLAYLSISKMEERAGCEYICTLTLINIKIQDCGGGWAPAGLIDFLKIFSTKFPSQCPKNGPNLDD